MRALQKFRPRALHLLLRTFLAFPATLLLAASACGPLPEDVPSSEPLRLAPRADALSGDECASGANDCSPHATCTDTAEGYTCTCNADFAGDGVSCTRVSHTVELEPVADATVDASQPGSNFGSASMLSVVAPWFHPTQEKQAFLRFDLSTLPAHARISSARLQVSSSSSCHEWGADGSVYTHLAQDDAWSEGGLTWNNKPASSGTSLGSWRIGTSCLWVQRIGVNESPALAATVRSELQGDKQLSVRLSTTSVYNEYISREFSDVNLRPKLEVHYVEPEICDVQPNVPVLTLNGGSEVTVECGLSTWTDPGAQATDACGPLEVHRYNSGSDAYGPGPNLGAEGSYTVQYIAWSPTGGTVNAWRTVHVNDSTAPSLRLKGAAQMSHTCGSQFVDPGVEALDACYGEVSPMVRVTGYVNGWAPGTYTVRYDVTDSGGNSATPVTRTVTVANCPW